MLVEKKAFARRHLVRSDSKHTVALLMKIWY